MVTQGLPIILWVIPIDPSEHVKSAVEYVISGNSQGRNLTVNMCLWVLSPTKEMTVTSETKSVSQLSSHVHKERTVDIPDAQ